MVNASMTTMWRNTIPEDAVTYHNLQSNSIPESTVSLVYICITVFTSASFGTIISYLHRAQIEHCQRNSTKFTNWHVIAFFDVSIPEETYVLFQLNPKNDSLYIINRESGFVYFYSPPPPLLK